MHRSEVKVRTWGYRSVTPGHNTVRCCTFLIFCRFFRVATHSVFCRSRPPLNGDSLCCCLSVYLRPNWQRRSVGGTRASGVWLTDKWWAPREKVKGRGQRSASHGEGETPETVHGDVLTRGRSLGFYLHQFGWWLAGSSHWSQHSVRLWMCRGENFYEYIYIWWKVHRLKKTFMIVFPCFWNVNIF